MNTNRIFMFVQLHCKPLTKSPQCRTFAKLLYTFVGVTIQRELFLSEVNNKETIVAIETNNDTYYLQKRMEKFQLHL